VAGAELKENPGVKVGDTAGGLRSMMLRLGVGVVSELCTFTPSEEDVGLWGDEEDTENGKSRCPDSNDRRREGTQILREKGLVCIIKQFDKH
jgi:hypothetical protein